MRATAFISKGIAKLLLGPYIDRSFDDSKTNEGLNEVECDPTTMY